MGIMPDSTVVGVFENRLPAEQAVADLRQAGFGDDQIAYGAPGELGEQSERPTENEELPGQKGKVENEFQQGRCVVTVKAGERAHEARAILHRHGAFDAYTPLSEETKHGASTGTDAADTLHPDQAVELNASSSFFEQPVGTDPRLPGTRPSPDLSGPRVDENN